MQALQGVSLKGCAVYELRGSRVVGGRVLDKRYTNGSLCLGWRRDGGVHSNVYLHAGMWDYVVTDNLVLLARTAPDYAVDGDYRYPPDPSVSHFVIVRGEDDLWTAFCAARDQASRQPGYNESVWAQAHDQIERHGRRHATARQAYA